MRKDEDSLQNVRGPFVSPVVSYQFETLLAFLDRFQLEVGGRAEAGPTDEMREKLARFAEGKSSQEERQELCDAMRDNPALVRWVADHVKKQRER